MQNMLFVKDFNTFLYTDKPVNKGPQGKDRTWSLQTNGLYLEVILFYFIKEGYMKLGLYLQVCLYSEMAFNTGLTVHVQWLDFTD